MALVEMAQKLSLQFEQYFPVCPLSTNYLALLNLESRSPGFMNSLAGLLSTLASIYGAQHGQFSTTSKSTLIVTGVCSAVFGILTAIYSLWVVRRVKARHDREVGKQRTGKHGEGVVDVSTRRL